MVSSGRLGQQLHKYVNVPKFGCFRDYKEHNDDKDKSKYGNMEDSDPWNANGRRPGFNKSRSLDVGAMEAARAKFEKPKEPEQPQPLRQQQQQSHALVSDRTQRAVLIRGRAAAAAGHREP